ALAWRFRRHRQPALLEQLFVLLPVLLDAPTLCPSRARDGNGACRYLEGRNDGVLVRLNLGRDFVYEGREQLGKLSVEVHALGILDLEGGQKLPYLGIERIGSCRE